MQPPQAERPATVRAAQRYAARRGQAVALLLAAQAAGPAAGGEFVIRRLDDGRRVVRDPVIGAGGLVAWTGYRSDAGSATSDLLVYDGGEVKNLTEGVGQRNAEHIKPQVHDRSVVWVSSFTEPRTPPYSWTLIDVPDQHHPHPELDAQYAFTADDGTAGWRDPQSQRFWLPTNEVERADAPRKIHRQPVEYNELCLWRGTGAFERITYDLRDDHAPSIGAGDLVAWQKAKGFPFGWEIMVWEAGQRWQITTNYYYDMAPRVHERRVVWYGWDGQDYEIYLYDHDRRSVTQVTSNRYDDVSPVIWGDTVVWEAYPTVEADIYAWRVGDAAPRRISRNLHDDINPRIWKNYVVWQGFDGDDYEIFLYDLDTDRYEQITRNNFDDVQPQIRDGLVVWMGYYDNWDAEIFVLDLEEPPETRQPRRLTNNEYEDRDPMTAGRRVVWWTDEIESTAVYLAEPAPR